MAPSHAERDWSGLCWASCGKAGSEAIAWLEATSAWVNHPGAAATLIGYLEKRCAFLPDYQEPQRAGLWIASPRVEMLNDWAVSDRCKHHGMSWTPLGGLALASLELARCNGELGSGRSTSELPGRLHTQSVPKVA